MNNNVPKCFHTRKRLDIVDDKISCLINVDDSYFVVNIQEKHFEAMESFSMHVCRVKLLLIAHNLLKHFYSNFVIKQESSLSIIAIFIFFGQEQEKFLCLILSDSSFNKVIVKSA